MTRQKRTEKPFRFWTMARDWLHAYLPKVRRASGKTIDAYVYSLESLVAHLEALGTPREQISFDSLNREAIKAWVGWMSSEKGYSVKTVNLRLTAVKSFLRYCASEDMSLTGIYVSVSAIKGPKVQKALISYLETEETKALLGAYEGKTQKERRNRAMLVFLYESGARVSELTSVSVGDLYLGKPARVTLLGKGGKPRVVPIGDVCTAHMKVYMKEFHPDPDPQDPLFFCVRGGARHSLSSDAVSLVLKNAGKLAKAGCPSMPDLHCHIIRKTRAMDLYRAGVPLALVAQLLGHESVSTTSGFYAFATDDMMERAVEAAAPDALKLQMGYKPNLNKSDIFSFR